MKDISVDKMIDIPPGKFLICRGKKFILSRFLSAGVYSCRSFEGPSIWSFFILIFDSESLLYFEDAGNCRFKVKEKYETICQDFKKSEKKEINEKYFAEPPDSLKEKYTRLSPIKIIDTCLISS